MISEQSDYTPVVGIILNLLIMTLFCLVIVILLLRNVVMIIRSSKIYYLLLGLTILAKLLGYVIYGIRFIVLITTTTTVINIDSPLIVEFELAYKVSLMLTDIAMVELFLLTCRHYLMFYSRCSFVQIHNDVPQKICVLAEIAVFLALSSGLTVFLIDNSTWNNVLYLFAICNFFSLLALLLSKLYLNIKLTGALVDKDTNVLLNRFVLLQVAFGLGRLVSGGYEIAVADYIQGDFLSLFKGEVDNEALLVLLCFVVFLLLALVTQGIPIALSLRQSTIALLAQPSERKKSLVGTVEDGYYAAMVEEAAPQPASNTEIQPNIREFQEQQEMKSRLGTLRKGLFRGRLVMIRDILAQVSRYLKEQLEDEIASIKSSGPECIAKVQFYLSAQHHLYLVTDFYPMTLDKYISEKHSLENSVEIAYRVSAAIELLHRNERAHGTLKPENIYLNGQTAYLGNFGLLQLKKFMNLTAGYTNKSVYTAPQLLAEKTNVITKPTKKADVYAFGLILYELFTFNTEHKLESIKNIEMFFGQQESRPKLPATLPGSLRNLIQNCWQQQPSSRPSMENVTFLLKEYK